MAICPFNTGEYSKGPKCYEYIIIILSVLAGCLVWLNFMAYKDQQAHKADAAVILSANSDFHTNIANTVSNIQMDVIQLRIDVEALKKKKN
jgi:hypothetical protein